jgi:(p)ppGpp synthase/HD superfamily hydrolase
MASKKIFLVDDLIKKARSYAIQAHKRINHRIKYTNQPYDVHLKAVAELVSSVSGDPETIAAAWLHDTVEDTPITFHDIEKEFGSGVVQLVSDLTDVSKTGDGNRSVRKAIDRAHLAQAVDRAKTIKLADLIDDCRDISSNSPRFARVYLTEMAALLEVLGDGDAELYGQARRTFSDCATSLKNEHMPLLSQSWE